MEYKGYRIVPLGNYPMYRIQPNKSGDIPDVLKGTFTTPFVAKQSIDRYLSSLKTRGRKKNVTEQSTSSD